MLCPASSGERFIRGYRRPRPPSRPGRRAHRGPRRALHGDHRRSLPRVRAGQLVVLARSLAFDFLVFAQRNPKPCPLLEVLDSGDPEPRLTAPGADVRTDLPAYRVYRDGTFEGEVGDLVEHWIEDAVAGLFG